jgi:putative membrane-bound dehydrogenase-like protein
MASNHSNMNRHAILAAIAAFVYLPTHAACSAEPPPKPGKTVPLFDGATLAGWEGDATIWRVQEGSLTGGSLTQTVKQNEFLATTRDYTNFIVRFKIKLIGTNGFINSGFQIRSQRVPNNSEMAGYQCDFGEPNWYGAIYDESRRNKVMSASDMKALRPVLRKDDWNDYVIRADAERVTTWINGAQGTDYREGDPTIPDWGKLGIQVHGGGKALVQVKDISIEELPPTPVGKRFIGAPEPKKSANSGPLSPEEERAAFTLPPGFEIELVAAESDGIGKFVAIDWDLQGRLWTMTALEYPVDANESPAVAKELYASKAKDKVVVFDRDASSPTGYSSKPRVFADGLAIPLGVLPYKNGVYVQHGSDIVFLSDADGDGKADQREVILSGFGVQDSHLFPHQFTRAPGNWIWMAQGAFNYGKVKTSKGSEVKFDQTRMARFRYDGSDFEITSQGPCNIWGLAMTAEGETWIQEANDYGYPAMPFHAYANYPGCSDAQMKSYAPEFPGTAPDFKMGGTGLSGLALSDPWVEKKGRPAGFPPPYADVLYVANPITRKIQAIKTHRDGPRYRLQKLPDFIQSSDEMFRPVALRTGPDGCLYVVDWYNKIISHNEVPRNHPERDKKRGRIWRVKHQEQTPFPVPDFTRLSATELLARLGGESTTQSHLAWQAITDRQMTGLAPRLKGIVVDRTQPPGRRIASLWALEGLDQGERFGKGVAYFPLLKPLLDDPNRNIRREAIRVLGARAPSVAGASKLWTEYFDALDKAGLDPEPEVRAEVIKTTVQLLGLLGISSDSNTTLLSHQRALPLLVGMARPSLPGPTAPSTHSGKSVKIGEAYDREFERYLVRMFLETRPDEVAAFLGSPAAKSIPVENRLVATLALEPKASAPGVAELLPQLTRPPGQEEVLRLAQFLDQPGAADALKRTLQNSATSVATLEALLKVRTRLDPAKITPLLTDTARALWSGDSSSRALGLRLITAFKLAGMEASLDRSLSGGEPVLADSEIVPALRAMRELGASQLEGVLAFVGSPRREVADEALAALASSRNETAPPLVFKLWTSLNATQRQSALNTLSGSRHGALAMVKAVRSGRIRQDELSPATLDKLHAVLGKDADLAALMQQMDSVLQPVVRFDGKPDTFVWTKYQLAGPFTVECWLKLDPSINNQDGILSCSNQLDLNFHDSQFRVWVAGGQHDIVVAKRKTMADVWNHYAVTRDAQGVFRIYVNGELEAASTGRNTNTFTQLDVGRTNPKNGGTAGWMNEFRVWNVARSAGQILADFDRTYRGEAGVAEGGNSSRAPGLMSLLTGTQWPSFHGAVKIQKVLDAPPLLTSEEAKALARKFSRFQLLAEKSGDLNNGKRLFTSMCQQCHTAGSQGGQVGPVLSGAGAMGVESLLRNLLTPNAAMEPGYRVFRVELQGGDVLDGIRVSEDHEAIVLRRPNVEDTRIAQKEIVKAGFTRSSMMPEGLLDALKPEEVTDLFAFLKTLK